MFRGKTSMNETGPKNESARILQEVPPEKGFLFSMPNGESTNVTAVSLEDFSDKLKTVSVESIAYHYPRGDFQKWVEEVLGDRKLANSLCFIETGISAEFLRNC
jgi:hypothetical protein